ncbi:MAG: sugar ABC transporter substrate-binding protein, partial [Symbiobacteriaceae bacterium]
MRRVVAACLTAALLLAGCGGTASQPEGASGSDSGSGSGEGPIRIGLTQIVEHPALDATRQGIIDGLREAGYEDGKQIAIDFQSAQGEQPVAQQIAEKFVADKKDLIIAIATPSAQAVVQATRNNPVPVVFSAVTDPLSAGPVSDLQRP